MIESNATRLGRIGTSYRGALASETRRRIVTAGVREARSASRSRTTLGLPGGLLEAALGGTLRGLAFAAVAAILVTPALLQRGSDAPGDRSPVRDLSVAAQGDQVVLTWSDGGEPRKVVRATSRGDLENLASLPAHTATGERWVDESPADSDIVYYFVE